MAEKKVTAIEQAAQEAREKAVQTTENGNLVVEREVFTSKKSKREMYGYCVKGKYNGRVLKVDLSAADQGGYETLDLIFSIKPTAELLISEEEMTNDGVKTSYTVYEVCNVDENGIEIKYKVKPTNKSDLTYLNVLLQVLALERETERKAAEEKANAEQKESA